MLALIIIIIVVCAVSSSNNSQQRNQQYYQAPRKISKREMKKLRKAKERAEMDAWEDMMAMFEACCDD